MAVAEILFAEKVMRKKGSEKKEEVHINHGITITKIHTLSNFFGIFRF